MRPWAAPYMFFTHVSSPTDLREPLSCPRAQHSFQASFRWISSARPCHGIRVASRFRPWRGRQLVDYGLDSFRALDYAIKFMAPDNALSTLCVQALPTNIPKDNASL